MTDFMGSCQTHEVRNTEATLAIGQAELFSFWGFRFKIPLFLARDAMLARYTLRPWLETV